MEKEKTRRKSSAVSQKRAMTKRSKVMGSLLTVKRRHLKLELLKAIVARAHCCVLNLW